jgi:predicted TIM-barrel fold metal-dependent hydrolase
MRLTGLVIVVAFALALASCATETPGAGETPSRPRDGRVAIIDTHVHPARNVLRGGLPGPSGLLQRMDDFALERVVLLPPPFVVRGRGTYGRREIEEILRGGHGRLLMVAGGESLNPTIQGTSPDGVSASVMREFREEAEAIASAGAVGFGEIALEHFSSGRGRHPYESTPPDHPLVLLLADIAAERRMIVDVHMEAVPVDTPTRSGLRGANPGELHANIAAFERLLDHNRDAKIVWAHAGWDLTGERRVPLMRSLLGRHPNLYMSIKIDSSGFPGTNPMGEDGIRPGWIAMLRAFPDRFVIGSDQFLGDDTERLERARRFIDELPADLAGLVAHDNALHLYRLAAPTP